MSKRRRTRSIWGGLKRESRAFKRIGKREGRKWKRSLRRARRNFLF